MHVHASAQISSQMQINSDESNYRNAASSHRYITTCIKDDDPREERPFSNRRIAHRSHLVSPRRPWSTTWRNIDLVRWLLLPAPPQPWLRSGPSSGSSRGDQRLAVYRNCTHTCTFSSLVKNTSVLWVKIPLYNCTFFFCWRTLVYFCDTTVIKCFDIRN